MHKKHSLDIHIHIRRAWQLEKKLSRFSSELFTKLKILRTREHAFTSHIHLAFIFIFMYAFTGTWAGDTHNRISDWESCRDANREIGIRIGIGIEVEMGIVTECRSALALEVIVEPWVYSSLCCTSAASCAAEAEGLGTNRNKWGLGLGELINNLDTGCITGWVPGTQHSVLSTPCSECTLHGTGCKSIEVSDRTASHTHTHTHLQSSCGCLAGVKLWLVWGLVWGLGLWVMHSGELVIRFLKACCILYGACARGC